MDRLDQTLLCLLGFCWVAAGVTLAAIVLFLFWDAAQHFDWRTC
jgi:hypothetical protein